MRISYQFLKRKYYYTIKDLLMLLEVESIKLFDITTIKDIIDNNFTDYIKASGYYYDGLHSNNFWNLLYAKYRKQFILCSNKAPNELTTEDIFDGLEVIFTRIQETYPKYDLLLNKYASVNDFFKPLKNTTAIDTTNRFNDTPQIASGYEGDSYATNYSKNHSDTISESDGNTIMARIMEVDLNYKNLLEEWVKSFFELFIEESNVIGFDEEINL